MKFKLEEIAKYSNKKIEVDKINCNNYISTENMLPNKLGIVKATSLPKQSKVCFYEKDNILISNIRPYFKKIWFANCDGGCSNDVLNIMVSDTKKILPKFLYYLLYQDNFFDYVMAGNRGTKMPRGDKKHIMKYTVNIPSTEKQIKIIDILDSIDKKIEINNKINDNLYKVLNMIFQEYFCNKQDDENFEKIQLKDLISIRGGLAYKASLLSDNVDDNILVSMGNVELNTIFNFNNLKHYSENVENRYVGKIGDLFICTRDVTQKRNQLGCPGIIPKIFKGKNVIIGTNLYIVDILNNKKNFKYFLYLLMNSNEYRERIVGSAKGTAVLMIAKDDILKFEFCYPKEEKIIDDFNNKVTPIFEKIESIIVENDRLSNLRETLLPKLMNGEIDLDKIEI